MGWKGQGKYTVRQSRAVYYFIALTNPYPPPCYRIRDTYICSINMTGPCQEGYRYNVNPLHVSWQGYI